MRAYSIFDDFTVNAINMLLSAGIDVTVHPLNLPRPNKNQMKSILEEYDCIIIGTSQKITSDMFENINASRIIATASVGIDHITIPEEKKSFIKVINTTKSNAQSVAEYTIACMLSCAKRLDEGKKLYRAGNDNKFLSKKPEDICGKTIGVVGAGNISIRIMEYARFLGMKIICWTRNPDSHKELEKQGVQFVSLNNLFSDSDVVSVNIPNNLETNKLISSDLISKMKSTAIFISVSRIDTIDIDFLLNKALQNPEFYICLDLDVNIDLVKKIVDKSNIIITPHIAGGTVEARERMFFEVSEKIVTEYKYILINEGINNEC